MTEVFNLAVNMWKAESVYDLPPREAVIAAYAQSRGDYSTSDYERKYGGVVQEGIVSWFCGNYGAWKQENETMLERLEKTSRKN